MKTIWKYELNICDRQTIEVPASARMLTLQTQGDSPRIWALVDTEEKESVRREFHTFLTGGILPESDNLEYIGTYQILGGSLIYHVFEKI